MERAVKPLTLMSLSGNTPKPLQGDEIWEEIKNLEILYETENLEIWNLEILTTEI